jgi:hypothetical protein
VSDGVPKRELKKLLENGVHVLSLRLALPPKLLKHSAVLMKVGGCIITFDGTVYLADFATPQNLLHENLVNLKNPSQF